MIFRVENRIGDAGLPARETSDHGTMKAALFFAALGIGLAVALAPLMQNVATSRTGLDRLETGSVARGERITIRRSVLSDGVEKICDGRTARTCAGN